jgi:polysaccharide export outer membrane protein
MHRRLVRAIGAAAILLAQGCRSVEEAPRPAPGPVIVLPERDVPPARDYRLGPRDLIQVSVFELERPGEWSRLDLEVDARGEVAVPFAGCLTASGRTTPELRSAVAAALAGRVLVKPEVVVAVKEPHAFQVSVTGAVTRPGTFTLARNRISVLDALALAGGLTKDAGTTAQLLVRRTRPSPAQTSQRERIESQEVDLIALAASMTGDVELEAGSRVHVPEAREFFVTGFVARGGGFPYHRPTTVLQAVGLAGGLDERKASASCVKIARPKAGGVEVIDVDLGAIASGSQPDVPILPGDTIVCGRTLVKAVVVETLDALRGFASLALTPGMLVP